ncbi:hypothetical protein JXI42_05260 [bacterium]|nr:hypothetical protein [bacterium]
MNIFVLDLDINKCARYHADQHVIKMILESTQMLCTVVNKSGGSAPYKTTHTNHPCTLWAGESLSNWQWLRRLVFALNREYKYRFGRSSDHASAQVARELSTPGIEDIGITEFAQAMPDKYKVPGDAVKAYRLFYTGEKAKFAKWTRRRTPKWFRKSINEQRDK